MYFNLVLALTLIGVAIYNLHNEKRKGFHWIWPMHIFAGALWFLLYISDLIESPVSLRTLMGTGYIRATISLTLAVLVGMDLLLRIPRIK